MQDKEITRKRKRGISEATLTSKTPIELSELTTDWKEKTFQLWNSSFPCKRPRLEMITNYQCKLFLCWSVVHSPIQFKRIFVLCTPV